MPPKKKAEPVNPDGNLRSKNENKSVAEHGLTNILRSTYINDGARPCNQAPVSVQTCKSIHSAKREINLFLKHYPSSNTITKLRVIILHITLH